MRGFIAIDPSPEVHARLVAFIHRLQVETRGFKWVRPEGLHLTLRFLGEVDDDVVATIQQRLKQLAELHSPMMLSVRGVGFFPSPKRPRVFWTGIEGDIDCLQVLQAAIQEKMKDLPVHQEKEGGFHPHLTLARIADTRRLSRVERVLEIGKASDLGMFEAKTVILYKSRLTPQGSVYTKLSEHQLRGETNGS